MSKARANGEGSIYPYRNGYAAYVWVTTPSGKRTRKYVYGKTREAVHEKWVQLHQKAKAGPVASKVPTLAAYLSYWLDEVVAPNRAPLTYSTYETLIRLYISPGLGSKRLDRLRVGDVQRWLNSVRTKCQCCAQGKDARRPEDKRRCCARGECCEQFPSDRTVRDLRTVLRSALTSAETDELIARNVAKLVKLPANRPRKPPTWSSDEARRFLEFVRAEGNALYAAYVLILVLGLRKGEVLGLAWEDVDLDNGELSVAWQLQRVGGKLIRRQTKTAASDATLPLPDICVTALRLRQVAQREARATAGEAWTGSGLVFTSRFGDPIEPRNLNRYFADRSAKAEVRPITVHTARRTCATLLVDLGVHPRVIMRVLRHAQVSITMEIYAQASTKATREALKRLGDSLGEAAG